MPEHDPSDAGGVFDFGSFFFVVVGPNQSSFDIVDTMIHESVHVFQKAMEYVGETAGNETEAYQIASIATNLLKDYNALHEKWKEGLQTRSRSLHKQTGSEEKASGTECGSSGNGKIGTSL